jgi:hypothetical protein
MNAATRSELLRLTLTLTPALAITAIGGLALLAGIDGLGLVIGGAIATVLVGFGGLAVAASHNAALHVAATAALGSFVIRIGGAGATAAVCHNHPLVNSIISGLAIGLLAALALDLLTWFRVACSADALMTNAKESARV